MKLTTAVLMAGAAQGAWNWSNNASGWGWTPYERQLRAAEGRRVRGSACAT